MHAVEHDIVAVLRHFPSSEPLSTFPAPKDEITCFSFPNNRWEKIINSLEFSSSWSIYKRSHFSVLFLCASRGERNHAWAISSDTHASHDNFFRGVSPCGRSCPTQFHVFAAPLGLKSAAIKNIRHRADMIMLVAGEEKQVTDAAIISLVDYRQNRIAWWTTKTPQSVTF